MRTGFVPPVDALMGSEHIANVRVAPMSVIKAKFVVSRTRTLERRAAGRACARKGSSGVVGYERSLAYCSLAAPAKDCALSCSTP